MHSEPHPLLGQAEISEKEFHHDIHPNPALWLPAVREIAQQHDIEAHSLKAYTDGVNLVAAVDDDYVLKIFPPFLKHQWESDHRTLKHLQGKLSLPIPKFVAADVWQNDWTYLIMSRLEGVTLESVWKDLERSNKIQIMAEIGRTMAEVRQVPVEDLATLPPPWESFLEKQKSDCKSRHQRFGMFDWFLDGLDDFIKRNELALAKKSSDRVILTGEYTPFNLLVQKIGEDYKLCGMIDFADSMIGPAEYDLLGPSLFLGEGDADLIGALFHAYGKPLDLELKNRLLLLQVLHRYSDFRSQLRVEGWEASVTNFDELRDFIWPLSNPEHK